VLGVHSRRSTGRRARRWSPHADPCGVGARSYNAPAPAAVGAPSLLAASARAAPRGALTLLLLAAVALLLLVHFPAAFALLRRRAASCSGQLFRKEVEVLEVLVNRFPEWPLHKERCAAARARVRARAAAAAAAAERAAAHGRPSWGRRLVAHVAHFAAARPAKAEGGRRAAEEPGEVLTGPPRDRISAGGLRRVGRVQRAAARAAAAAAATEDASYGEMLAQVRRLARRPPRPAPCPPPPTPHPGIGTVLTGHVSSLLPY
jgi:hypothetical protein